MCVNKPASVTSVNELTLSSASEVPTMVEYPPDVLPVEELSLSSTNEVLTTVTCPPHVSPVNEVSLSSASEIPTTVECPPDVSSLEELSLSSANAPSSLTCGMFYSKKRDTEKVQTDSCVNKTNSRRSERKTCRPKRYQ